MVRVGGERSLILNGFSELVASPPQATIYLSRPLILNGFKGFCVFVYCECLGVDHPANTKFKRAR